MTESEKELPRKPKKKWKLQVQGVVVEFLTPTVIVKDALEEAGIDLNMQWIIILMKSGKTKVQVDLEYELDLSDPGIEKLRLTPKEINNGDCAVTKSCDFELLKKDREYLDRCDFEWETVIDTGRRWLIIRQMRLPDGYTIEFVDVAIEIPSTYPRAKLDMFYCYPPLSLSCGKQIPKTDAVQNILGNRYQRWSRHLNGATRWDPTTDSVITHMAFVDAAIGLEVGI